ncbi:hypothetical protein DFJ74DRAFT_706890 [Hyaloraphidium curvatum]|nr:hypothetical protein DFJ74DRAFT_706890 [Hyaloraphidium curvatum]
MTTYNASAARAFQRYGHGVDAVYDESSGRYLVVYSLNTAAAGAAWRHDVRGFFVDPGRGNATAPFDLAATGNAKEPSSAAVSSAGRLLVTAEEGAKADGWDALPAAAALQTSQSFGVWDLRGLAAGANGPPPVTRLWGAADIEGGHSGHVSALGEDFLIAYGEGRTAVQDDGAGLGPLVGNTVRAWRVASDGSLKEPGPLVVSPDTGGEAKDFWPLVASSADAGNWIVVWQRYPSRQLWSQLVSSAGQVLADPGAVLVASNIMWYHYTVEYSRQLDRFLVLGRMVEAQYPASAQPLGSTGGFLASISPKTGEIDFISTGLLSPVRECKMIFVDAPKTPSQGGNPYGRRRLNRRSGPGDGGSGPPVMRRVEQPAGLWEHVPVSPGEPGYPYASFPDFDPHDDPHGHLAPRQAAPKTVAYVVYPTDVNRLALINVTVTEATPWYNLTVTEFFPGVGTDGYAYQNGTTQLQRVAFHSLTARGMRNTHHSVDAFATGSEVKTGTGDGYQPTPIDPSAADGAFTILAAIFTTLFVLFTFGIGYWKMWEAGDGCFKRCPRKKRSRPPGIQAPTPGPAPQQAMQAYAPPQAQVPEDRVALMHADAQSVADGYGGNGYPPQAGNGYPAQAGNGYPPQAQPQGGNAVYPGVERYLEDPMPRPSEDEFEVPTWDMAVDRRSPVR